MPPAIRQSRAHDTGRNAAVSILVTGGAGFIGSHLVDALIKQGEDVILIDNLHTGQKANVNDRALFYHMDLKDLDGLAKIFTHNEIHAVFHLAGRVNVRESLREPVDYAQVNVVSSLALMELARVSKVKRFVFTSTGGAIYGEGQQADGSIHSFCEQDQPQPLDHYAVNKLAIEHHLHVYRQAFNFPGVVLRLANVYGPRQNPAGEAGVVSIFTDAMLRRQEVHISGDGRQVRDFCYISDVVEACLSALKYGHSGVYNIGTGQATSVGHIFERLAALTNYHRAPVHVDRPPGEVEMSSLDSSKALQDWGWSARMDLEQGLMQVVQFMQDS